MINNRQQSGRRRGRGGQRQGGPGGNPGGGNRIDNRARGNANQLWEKYKSLAADAARAGDRVQTEYYLQFADHYYRVLAETRPNFQEQQRQQRARDEQLDEDGYPQDADGDDYGDEGESIRPGEQAMQPRGDRGDRGDRNERRFDERRPRRDEDDRPRRAEEDRRPQRDVAQRDASQRDVPQRDEDRPRRADEERRPRRDRERDQDRYDAGGQEAGGRERFNGQPRPDAPMAVEAPAEPDLPLPDLPPSEPAADAPQPRRRGRPRKEVVAAEEPLGFDADRLPPALNAPANDPDESKPRRRRTRTATGEAPAAE